MRGVGGVVRGEAVVRGWRWAVNYRWIFVGSVVLAACSESGPRPPNADERPPTITLETSTVTSGFALGKIRAQHDVGAFRITKAPVTVGQYKQCVAVGACGAPALRGGGCDSAPAPRSVDGATYSLDPDLPVTCMTPTQAAGYCRWQGGSLPTESEWLLAARGSAPRRYAWGNFTPTCAQHPGSRDASCLKAPADFRVGKHPEGRSQSGMEDILNARGELLRASPNAEFGACNGETSCVVSGVYPGGEIDGVAPVASNAERLPASMKTFGFRCSFAGGAQ